MEKKLIILSITILALVISILPMVFAGIAVETPTNATNITSSASIRVSYVNATDIHGVAAANSTCYHNASGTWTSFSGTITVQEAATSGSNITMSPTTSSLTDTKGMAVNCSLGNQTVKVGITSGGYNYVTLDNTNPVVTVDLDEDSISVGGLFHYDISISDATSGIERQSCNITDPESAITSAGTSASNTLFSSSRTVDAGTWTLSCKAGDYTGHNVTKSDTLKSKSLSAPYRIGTTGILAGLDKKTVIIGIIIAIGILWLIGRKK